jgi:structure-specific endonuclease subunit SLX1
VWKAVDEKMEAGLRSEIEVCVDEHAIEHYEKTSSKAAAPPIVDDGTKLPLNGVENLDFGYSSMKSHVEKSRSILAGTACCSVCANRILSREELLLVCEHEQCNAVSHLACLSKHFTQSGVGTTESLVPLHGSCPSCKQPSRWQKLVKELSLRARGEKELAKIFKKPRARKNAAGPKASEPDEETMTAEELEESEGDEFIELEEFEAQMMKEALQDEPKSPSKRKAKGNDDFMDLEEFEAQIIENAFRRRPSSPLRSKTKAGTKTKP